MFSWKIFMWTIWTDCNKAAWIEMVLLMLLSVLKFSLSTNNNFYYFWKNNNLTSLFEIWKKISVYEINLCIWLVTVSKKQQVCHHLWSSCSNLSYFNIKLLDSNKVIFTFSTFKAMMNQTSRIFAFEAIGFEHKTLHKNRKRADE